MGDDYELIAALPDGTIALDLINETAHHSEEGIQQFWITGELAAWLRHRLAVHHIPAAEIKAANLIVSYSTNRVKTNRKKVVSFDFSCRSYIQTESAQYDGELIEKHTYHQRVGT